MNICRLAIRNIFNILINERINPKKISFRTTFIVKRRLEPPVTKFNARRQRILKAKHFIYDTVEDTDLTDPPDLHVVLTTFVEGIGDVGDVISLDPYYARDNLLLPHKAAYATPENIEKYSNMRKTRIVKARFSSIHAGMTVKTLSKSVIPVFMNPKVPWTLNKMHIQVAFRTEGYDVPEDAFEMPTTPIKGPDPIKEAADFAVYVTINNTERVPVRCRLFHIKQGLETAHLADEYYLEKGEPILAEQKDLLESMQMPEIIKDLSSGISLVEKYRIKYIE
ncbi:39S ribosomal protein L9, mitochondrial [Trichonephila inaurata madagascariensis]|uniref:Large ribosomal subunit protein bL9m n=1 Tax=Trichonephila inaurata madagascariensis TaxID=2747483 RepID=A0A8X6XLX5_9ARAC|nr:39S ribosomal protein L9, mitochondrial [Trichonephila inaurata madagascariensis]